MLPVKSSLSKMTRKLVELLPKKLMLEVSGLDAGKFWMVQLPTMSIWEGGTGLTKPSITPLFCGDGQVYAACAGTAVSSNSANGNSRILIQLPCGLALFVSLEVIYALVPLTKRFAAIGTEAATLWAGFRRSRRHGALRPVRPVTLRRHLSMALPLSKSRQN